MKIAQKTMVKTGIMIAQYSIGSMLKVCGPQLTIFSLPKRTIFRGFLSRFNNLPAVKRIGVDTVAAVKKMSDTWCVPIPYCSSRLAGIWLDIASAANQMAGTSQPCAYT